MERSGKETRDASAEAFQREAGRRSGSFLGEIWFAHSGNRKWWLLPLIVVLVLAGGLVALGGTAVAPFLDPLF